MYTVYFKKPTAKILLQESLESKPKQHEMYSFKKFQKTQLKSVYTNKHATNCTNSRLRSEGQETGFSDGSA